MYSFASRRARGILFSGLAVFAFLVFFQLYSSGLREELTTYASSFGEEPLAIGHEGKGAPQNDLDSAEFLTEFPPPKASSAAAPSKTRYDEVGPSPTHTLAAIAPHDQSDKPLTATSTLASQSLDQFQSSSTVAGEYVPSTPTPSQLSGAIVAAVGLGTDLGWVSEVSDPMWKVHRYNYDEQSPPPATHFPINKGNEAMMYLSYVINNYESLPDYSIFIHGHRESWHQEGDMVNIINNFRLPALDKAGYAPLRCDWYPSCPREIRPVDHDVVVWGPGVHREDTEYEIGRVWSTLFGNSTALPRTIASQCCAQFAVTRKAIHQRPKAEYERMRQFLIDTELINDVSGRIFEKLWAYIFTKEAVRCPPPQQCACEYFGQCELKAWTMPPAGLQKWADEFDHYVPGMNVTVLGDGSNSTLVQRQRQER